MAWSFQLNTFPATGGRALWELKEFLVTQGWDVPRSGSGTGGAYGNDPGTLPADVHSPGGPYTGTLDLANAWFELRQPITATPRRSFMFQTSYTYSTIWAIWYSSDGTGFTGGTPNASTRSTAADEQAIANTGWTAQWLPNSDSYRIDILAGDASEGHGMFFGARIPDATSGYAAVLSLDVLGEADPADADPAVIGTNYLQYDVRFALNGSPLYYATSPSLNTGVSMGWYQKGLGSPAFVPYPAVFLGGFEGFGSNLVPVNADRLSQMTDGSYPDLPIWYWRGGPTFTTERGKKGRSTLYRASQLKLGIFRPNSTLTRMSIGALSIPWDGTTIPTF